MYNKARKGGGEREREKEKERECRAIILQGDKTGKTKMIK